MPTCLNCKREIPNGDVICPDCYHEEFPNKTKKPVKKEIEYCEICGMELEDGEERLCVDCQDVEDAEEAR